MASIRVGRRKDGTTYSQVLYRINGKQSSTSFNDYASAMRFCELIAAIGVEQALATLGVAPTPGITVTEWLVRYVDGLTGLQPATIADYRRFIRADIAPVLGALPLAALSRENVAGWVNGMTAAGASSKTVSNKAGFLSSALTAAVDAEKIRRNPAAGVKATETLRAEMTCLSREEFGQLLDAVDPYWRPLIELLVTSGMRWGEATALRPQDIDLAGGTVRIARSWKRYADGEYRIGPPKTKRSVRTVDVPARVLAQLDLSRELVFQWEDGRPVRSGLFHARVWQPAVTAAGLVPRPRIQDLRHTCASWLIRAGVSLAIVQAHLGHENIGTTIRTYTHLDRSSMKKTAEIMDSYVAPRQPAS